VIRFIAGDRFVRLREQRADGRLESRAGVGETAVRPPSAGMIAPVT
jgi:hypothetical protein